MAGVILILGLIAAGIFTENSAFYWAAGIIGGLVFFYIFIVAVFIGGVKKLVDKEFDEFDNLGRISQHKRIVGRRIYRGR